MAAPDAWAAWEGHDVQDDCYQSVPPLRLSLVFRDATGGELARGGFEHYITVHGGGTVLIDTVFDYDGDDNLEVVVDQEYDGEGAYVDVFSIFTARAGEVVPYAPAKGLKILEVTDADGDQRPDLVISLHEAMTSNTGIEGDSTTFPGLAHAVVGGAFDPHDAAARAFVERHCATLPAGSLPKRKESKRNDVATGHALICERRRGVPESQLLAELAPACPSFSPDLNLFEEPEQVPDNLPCPEWWRRWLEGAR